MIIKSKSNHPRSFFHDNCDEMALNDFIKIIISSVEDYISAFNNKKGFKVYLYNSSVLTKNDGVARVFFTENNAFVMCAQDLNDDESIFPIVHELGHLVLHLTNQLKQRYKKILKKNECNLQELEASYFAIHILKTYYGHNKAKHYITKAPPPDYDWKEKANLFRLIYDLEDRNKIKKEIEKKINSINNFFKDRLQQTPFIN
ncbi:MAG: ImmA/IrrE family metallo-endopeptidase [Defluviitaleaceae bacterium]|nr:ImmA/IrrE family metallo-endopeptidase [Defluviitaleaceae bacterium]MCL2604018.1 ImmA/IrrE family metallo-endopeptidase [Defluviitaleaceae bacterium]